AVDVREHLRPEEAQGGKEAEPEDRAEQLEGLRAGRGRDRGDSRRNERDEGGHRGGPEEGPPPPSRPEDSRRREEGCGAAEHLQDGLRGLPGGDRDARHGSPGAVEKRQYFSGFVVNLEIRGGNLL